MRASRDGTGAYMEVAEEGRIGSLETGRRDGRENV